MNDKVDETVTRLTEMPNWFLFVVGMAVGMVILWIIYRLKPRA
jgi:hypothetical protein